MKRFILSFLILATTLPAFSQKVYFIYLQSETEQPFFIKLNEKAQSSNASGYLILSNLRDSTYNFSIGFPGNKWPEQKFSVQVKGKDHGYLLKNFEEKGWGLFDLQTMTIQMALPSASSSSGMMTEPKEVSPFTAILAKAADDPSLRMRPVAIKTEEKAMVAQQAIVKEEVKTNPETQLARQDPPAAIKEDGVPPKADDIVKEEKKVPKPEETVVVKKEEPVEVKQASPTEKEQKPELKQDPPSTDKEQKVVEPKQEPVVLKDEPKKEETTPDPAPEYKKSVVTKKSESSTSEGFGLTFIDEYSDGKRDTIRILIPNPKRSYGVAKEQVVEEKKFLDIPPAADTMAAQDKPQPQVITEKTETPTAAAKKSCPSLASDADFLKLQKKMGAENDNDDRLDEAKKVFKTKCFATAQVKSLSTLFPDEGGKYRFFDLAYPYVSDKDNFPSLATELKDEYYVNRFRAMLR
jgi:hypothetical protein